MKHEVAFWAALTTGNVFTAADHAALAGIWFAFAMLIWIVQWRGRKSAAHGSKSK